MNKQIKIALIVLVIFALVSVGITYILIKNSTSNIYKENTNNKEINLENEKGIDLYGVYNENDLLINDLLETFSGEEIKIPQIEGLKNKQIEKKINKDIYNRCFDYIEENVKNIADFSQMYISYNVMSNFSNIISINYYMNVNVHLHLNYNLLTGEKLKLEDIFVKDADILEIVRDAYRERLSNYSYSFEFIDDDGVAIFDENELYKIVKGYMNTSEKDFMISPSEIYFYFNDSGASVKLIKIADEISIYTKYLTDESIYEKNDIGRKNIFTLVETNYDLFDIIDYGYLEDNFWYDVTVSKMYFPDGQIPNEKMEKFNAYAKTLTDEAYEKVNEYREKAKQNPDKFYILISTPNVSMYNDARYESGEWNYIYSNMAISNLNTKVYEMPIEMYKSEYKDKIIEGYRNNYFMMRGGMYYTIDEPGSGDNIIYTKKEEQRKYNYMISKEITDLSDVFYEYVNYMEILEERVRRELIKIHECSESEAEELLKSAKYDFEGWGINVQIPQMENFRLYIELGTFDKSMLNIFDTEYALITDDDKKVILMENIKLFNKEPVSEKEDRGDGFHWIDYTYDDIEVKAIFDGEDIEQYVNKIVTTSPNYKTPRNIKVGDSLLKLQEVYSKYLENSSNNSEKSLYIFDNEDEPGFYRIFFELENDIITKITIENGIDG